MKKAHIVLLAITAAFACVVLGFFMGRNTTNRYSVSSITAASSAADTQAVQQEKGKYDINTATVQQLQTLPNIGEVLAQRIVDYRQENGPFTCIEDICLVEGIGAGRLEKIRDYITVGG